MKQAPLSIAFVAAVAASAALAACGSAGGAASGEEPPATPSVPARLEIVCHADGSTELATRQVRALPDGVHVRVDNRAGEFVSLNGLGLDFSEGVTEQTASTPPGDVRIACWPGTRHSGPEPQRETVAVVDPEGHWGPGELECPGQEAIASSILDYASGGSGAMGDPEDIARREVSGLKPDDDIVTIGYREGEPREIAVRRDGRIVALLSYSAANQGGWFVGEYSACDSTGIDVH